MKSKFTLMSAFTVLITYNLSVAQEVSCEDLTIVDVIADPKTDQFVLSIEFTAASNIFINYPHVALVLDCEGDTVATGGLSFFGQFGETIKEYSVTATDAWDCAPLTAVLCTVIIP